MPDIQWAEQKVAVLEKHLAPGSTEILEIAVICEDDCRWQARFSGRSFYITASCGSVEAAYRLGVSWFSRAFPEHLCTCDCRRHGELRIGLFRPGSDVRWRHDVPDQLSPRPLTAWAASHP